MVLLGQASGSAVRTQKLLGEALPARSPRGDVHGAAESSQVLAFGAGGDAPIYWRQTLPSIRPKIQLIVLGWPDYCAPH